MFFQSVKLSNGDLVPFELVRLGKKRAHVIDKGVSNRSRKIQGFGGFHANRFAPAGVNFA